MLPMLPCPTPEQVLAAKRSLGYPVFTKPFDLNLVSLRHPERRAGRFDDYTGFVFTDEDGRLHGELYPSTTDPSALYLVAPARRAGTAILLPSHTPGSHGFGRHRDKYPALVQRRGIAYVRDNDRDELLDVDTLALQPGEIEHGVIGANIHHASSVNVAEAVGPWSMACQVLQLIWHWSSFMTIAELQPKYGHGSTFSLSLMPLDQVLQESP